MAKNVTYSYSVRTRHYGLLNFLFDLFMLVITGGLWALWIIFRYMRTH